RVSSRKTVWYCSACEGLYVRIGLVVGQFEFCEQYSPPRIGGVAAHQENIAKPPLKAQTGWSFWIDHPVRAFQRRPSAPLFDGTATPPILGGEYRLQNFKVIHYRR